MYIYIPIFFIYYLIVSRQIDKLILYGTLVTILCILIFNFKFANIDLLLLDIKRLTNIYASSAFTDGLSYFFNNFFGNGVGTATYQTVNITGSESPEQLRELYKRNKDKLTQEQKEAIFNKIFGD